MSAVQYALQASLAESKAQVAALQADVERLPQYLQMCTLVDDIPLTDDDEDVTLEQMRWAMLLADAAQRDEARRELDGQPRAILGALHRDPRRRDKLAQVAAPRAAPTVNTEASSKRSKRSSWLKRGMVTRMILSFPNARIGVCDCSKPQRSDESQ